MSQTLSLTLRVKQRRIHCTECDRKHAPGKCPKPAYVGPYEHLETEISALLAGSRR